MTFNPRELDKQQEDIAQRVHIKDMPGLDNVQYVGAFEVAHHDLNKMTIAAVILSWPSMKVVEKNVLTIPTPMKFVSGLVTFREGPGILQTYYDLEYDPQLILITGQGISHPKRAGLACFIGVELDKPTIGVSKKPMSGDVLEDDVVRGNERVAKLVQTKEHAKKLCVSPGHNISIDTAAEWVKKLIIPPHKKPEPLHIAGRIAKKASNRKNEDYETTL